AHHDEVDTVVEAARPGTERTQVHVQVECKTHAQQQAALQHTGRHVRCANRTEQNGVEVAQLFEHRVGQHLAGREVAAAAEVVVDGVDRDTRGTNDLQRLRDDLWS